MINDDDEYNKGWAAEKDVADQKAATKAQADSDDRRNESQTALESGAPPGMTAEQEYTDEWAADHAANKAQEDKNKYAESQTALESGVVAGPPMKTDEVSVPPVEPAKAEPAKAAEPAKSAAPATALSFKETFKAARLAGEKDFEWTRPDGTPYRVTTQLKGEGKPAQPAKSAAPAPPSQPLVQKLRADFDAFKKIADKIPPGTTDLARQTIHKNLVISEAAYNKAANAANAENAAKSGTSVAAPAAPPPKLPLVPPPLDPLGLTGKPGSAHAAVKKDPKRNYLSN